MGKGPVNSNNEYISLRQMFNQVLCKVGQKLVHKLHCYYFNTYNMKILKLSRDI